MNLTYTTIIVLLLITSCGFYVAKRWAFSLGKNNIAQKDTRRGLNSTPNYHGLLVAFYAILPAMLLLLVWTSLDNRFIDNQAYSQLPESYQQLPENERNLVLNKIAYFANNSSANISTEEDKILATAAQSLNKYQHQNKIILFGLVTVISLIGAYLGFRKIKPEFRARGQVELITLSLMILCASIAILTTLGIIFSVLFESLRFFDKVPFTEFMFGTEWSPQTALRDDQVGASGAFGALPLLAGTMFISFIAMLVAIPIGLLSAIYLAEYASKSFRAFAKPALEILAGIPTVVYGFFAALTVAPFIRNNGSSIAYFGVFMFVVILSLIIFMLAKTLKSRIEKLNKLPTYAVFFGINATILITLILLNPGFIGNTVNALINMKHLDTSSESALAAGLVMGIMIIPFVSSLSDDVITAVPQSLRDGSYGLGSTKSETIKLVVFPAALPGIMGGVLLAVSRAIGETMIVVMAAGLAANLTINPLEAVTTVTVQIVTLLVGDQEFDSAKTLAAFALGLLLFIVTLILNIIALVIVRKYREQYE